MKAKSLKVTILIVLAIMLFSGIAVSAYAFFTSDFYKSLAGKITSNKTEIEVSSFSDLWKYSVGGTEFNDGTTIGGEFNDIDNVSDTDDRLNLKFTGDITLDADITFNSDVHIDLGGYTLYLDGHELVFSHTYVGNAIISNGNVVVDEKLDSDASEDTVAKQGKIYFDTPYSKNYVNADVTFSLRSGDALTATDYYTDVSQNTVVIAYNALKRTAKKVVNYADTLPSTLSYAELVAMDVGTTTFDANLFLANKFCYVGVTSGSEPTAEETCAFVYQDLDLPQNVVGYSDVTIEYSSDNTAVLSNLGKVNAVTGAITDVNLTVTVKKSDTTIGETVLPLHVADTTSSDQILVIGKSVLSSYMMRFYKNISETETPSYSYVIARSMQIPAYIIVDGTTINYAYEAYSSDTFSSTTQVKDIFSKKTADANVYDLDPSSAMTYIQATVSVGSVSGTMKFAVTASDAGLVRTDASYAQDFIIDNYGKYVIITATEIKDTDGNVTGYDFETVSLYSPENGNANDKIKSVKYALINDTNSLYTLSGCDSALTGTENGSITVAPNKNPFEYVQTVQLDCVFGMDTDGDGTADTDVDIQVPVRTEVKGDGDNVAAFLVYYNYYEQMLVSNTGCYTAESFEMPFSTGNTTNDYIVCYDMVSYDADGNATWNSLTGVTVSLYYNGAVQTTLTPTLNGTDSNAYISYVPALNTYLTENGLTAYDLATYGDAKWIFNIDSSLLTSQNQDFELVYNYGRCKIKEATTLTAFVDTANAYKTTDFTIPGVVRYAQNGNDGDVSDQNLYYAIGAIFDDNFTTDSKYMYTDLLKQNLAVSITDTTTSIDVNGTATTVSTLLGNVTNFDGLKYLIGTTSLDLTGKDLSNIDRSSTATSGTIYSTNMSAIASMTSLETLILNNCNLGEVVDNTKLASVPPSDPALDGLVALKNLKTLDLANNYIYDFAFLLNMQSLNTTYVYGNLSATTIEGVFYGSVGLVNMEHFAEITDKGVLVYNGGSDSLPTLFTKSSGENDYKTLQNIEYQKKLKTGKSITIAYSEFVGSTPQDFGLKQTYTVTVDSTTTTYTVNNYTDSSALTWGYEGDDETTSTRFYVEYSLTLVPNSGDTIEVNIRVYFTVVRV